jgi:hypothetical protein
LKPVIRLADDIQFGPQPTQLLAQVGSRQRFVLD